MVLLKAFLRFCFTASALSLRVPYNCDGVSESCRFPDPNDGCARGRYKVRGATGPGGLRDRQEHRQPLLGHCVCQDEQRWVHPFVLCTAPHPHILADFQNKFVSPCLTDFFFFFSKGLKIFRKSLTSLGIGKVEPPPPL